MIDQQTNNNNNNKFDVAYVNFGHQTKQASIADGTTMVLGGAAIKCIISVNRFWLLIKADTNEYLLVLITIAKS